MRYCSQPCQRAHHATHWRECTLAVAARHYARAIDARDSHEDREAARQAEEALGLAMKVLDKRSRDDDAAAAAAEATAKRMACTRSS